MVKTNNLLKITFQSNISRLPVILAEAEDFIDKLRIFDKYAITLVARELIINAIIHGNKNNPASKVFFQIEQENCEHLEIVVEDEGSGFNYRTLDMELPVNPRRIKKRGYILINALSNKIEFSSKGNHIKVHMAAKAGSLS